MEIEFEKGNGLDKLQILADQMARLGLNYQSLDEKEDSLNNNRTITLENINSLVNNNDSNLVKRKKILQIIF